MCPQINNTILVVLMLPWQMVEPTPRGTLPTGYNT